MDAIVAKMRSARRLTVEVAPGRRVHLLRPREEQILAIWKAGVVTPDDVCAAAEGWEGFTEADLLGPALGSDAVVAFLPETFSEWARDRMDAMTQMAAAIGEAISAHFARRAAAEKN